jgi:membrane protein YdbS with pleckstrin-like domain
MHRYAKTLLYGMLALAIFAGVSFAASGRVNWVSAAATAAGVMIAYFFIVPRRGR